MHVCAYTPNTSLDHTGCWEFLIFFFFFALSCTNWFWCYPLPCMSSAASPYLVNWIRMVSHDSQCPGTHTCTAQTFPALRCIHEAAISSPELCQENEIVLLEYFEWNQFSTLWSKCFKRLVCKTWLMKMFLSMSHGVVVVQIGTRLACFSVRLQKL